MAVAEPEPASRVLVRRRIEALVQISRRRTMFNLEDRVVVFLNPSDGDNEREHAWAGRGQDVGRAHPTARELLTVLTLDFDARGFTAD